MDKIKELNNRSDESQWNPMKDDYQSDFNKYISGPGAGLDSDLQPGQQALQKSRGYNKNENKPYLMFRNMPQGMTIKALNNICSRHGKVTSVRDSKKNSNYFVDFETVADMEATFRALEHNNYRFQVLVGKPKNETPFDINEVSRNKTIAPVPPRSVGIDYENRNYRTSNKQNPRPKLKEIPLINPEANSDIPLKLLIDDDHTLERKGLYKADNNKKFNYKNGRPYKSMTEKAKEFVDKKHAESDGFYNSSGESYLHASIDGKKPTGILKCSQCSRQCDTVCERCSMYYCSLECQTNDWPNHRYICGKPKHLQKTPSPKVKESFTSQNKSPKTEIKNETKDLKAPSFREKSIRTTNTKPLPNICSPSAYSSPETKKVPVSEDETYKQNMPRSGSIVTITSITKTNVLFVRSKTYEDNLSYFNTIEKLQALSKNLKHLEYVPKCGLVVIAKFENQYNRALVLNSNYRDRILINFMDYGSLDNVKLEDLYEAPKEFVDLPRHAIPVLLKDVPGIYMTEEIRKFMYTYLNDINVEIKYKAEDYCNTSHVFAVELMDEITQQNLNKVIIKLGKPVEPRNIDEICNRDYLKQKLLPSGDNVELIVMDNSLMVTGCISCTTIPFAIEIQKFQKELQAYAESLPKTSYAPRFNELCIARYSEDGLWYRGRCQEIIGDGHPSILFIDYGNIAIINIDDIRRYPRQFTYPIYTIDCEIQGLPENCNDKLVAKLEELIPHGEIIKCKTLKAYEEHNFYTISLPNVISELSTCGLI